MTAALVVDWRKRAACRPGQGLDPRFFDADRLPGESDTLRDFRHNAAAVACAVCPVAAQCLDDALADPTREGVYAGYVLQVERPDENTLPERIAA